MKRGRSSGFTLIELLVVVAIIGILAAIAIMNYLSAITRAKQKRTMADMRMIATAWEARAAEAQRYSPAGYAFPTTQIDAGTLESLLVPTFTKSFPKSDGWGRPLQFAVDPGGTGRTEQYAIRSAGRDGVFDGNTYAEGPTTDADSDIVYSGGTFIAYPQQGVQN